MMIILPFFNFTNSYRIVQNLLYIRETLERAQIPYTVIELAYGDREFCQAASCPSGKGQKKNNVIQLRSDSILFYRENLLNIASRSTYPKYTKFFYMDADVLFSERNWYNIVSDLLENYDGVHPYTNSLHLSPEFTIEGDPGQSVILDKDWGDAGLGVGCSSRLV